MERPNQGREKGRVQVRPQGGRVLRRGGRGMNVSVTSVEAYRLMTEEVISEFDLIVQLLKLEPYVERVNVGLQVHSLIETHDRIGTPEAWVSGDIAGVHIRGRVDMMHGVELREFKTTQSSFDPDRYLNSYQWRLYLVLSGCLKMVYRVFEAGYDRMSGLYYPKAAHTLPIGIYPNMERDCENMIRSFLDWHSAAESRGAFEEVRAHYAGAAA